MPYLMSHVHISFKSFYSEIGDYSVIEHSILEIEPQTR